MTDIGRRGRGGFRGGRGHRPRHHHGRGRGGVWFGPGPWWWDPAPMIVLDEDDYEVVDESPPKKITIVDKIVGAPTPDLPELWSDALQISVGQKPLGACSGESLVPFFHVVSLEGRPATRLVVVHDATYRSGQAVEAFVKKTPSGCMVLVQPVHMRPTSVAKCDTNYRITVPVPATCMPVTHVLLRSDRYAGKPSFTEARAT